MRIKQIIPVFIALLVPMAVAAQNEEPKVLPTATYINSEGESAEANMENTAIG